MADFTLCVNIFPWGLPPVTGQDWGQVVVREALLVLRPVNPSLKPGTSPELTNILFIIVHIAYICRLNHFRMCSSAPTVRSHDFAAITISQSLFIFPAFLLQPWQLQFCFLS